MKSFLLTLFLSLSALNVLADESINYQKVRDARPEGVVSAAGVALTRDAFTFRFASGEFHLLSAGDGKPFGAVFIGSGSYELAPATLTERHHLRVTSKDAALEKLTDRFDSAVFFFTDSTADELLGGKTPAPFAHSEPATVYEQYLKQQKSKYRTNVHLRVLTDLLNRPARKDGLFVALLDGEKFPPMMIAVDPMGIGNLGAQFSDYGGEEVALYCADDHEGGFWYLSARRGEARPGIGKPIVALVDAEHYSLTTHIDGRSLSGTATIRLTPLVDNLRVLPVRILPQLLIQDAELTASKTELRFVQEDITISRVARLFKDEVGDGDAAIIFPEPLEKGKKVEITISYNGDEVIEAAGPDVFSVRARDSWYPNLGTFNDLATYELTFHHPQRFDVISIGTKKSESRNPDGKVTVWESLDPVRVAGFNYGKFVKKSRKDDSTGFNVTVYTNKDWETRAGDAAIDALNAARVGFAFFGKPPHSDVSVTQQAEWSFGQSWPSLIFLPTLALTSQTERVFGIAGGGAGISGLNEFAETVGWHEISHQWWGHQVGWESYRDQWLSEGFAEFSAALTLQATGGTKKYNAFWDARRVQMFKNRGLIPNNDAGPISQGHRLATHQTPGAPDAILYGKGGYVVHMLRMLMRDPSKPNADERFIEMMKDFATTYRGKSPSTADFKRVAERYITPAMDLQGNGKLDYFFDQWVHGTEVPKIRSTLTATPTSGGKYRISGTVSQTGVSENFRTVVPLYISFGGDKLSRIAFLRLTGSRPEEINAELALPQPPKAVLVNAMNDVLVRD
jgi:hypothetical protein